jgi:hypothetical protein
MVSNICHRAALPAGMSRRICHMMFSAIWQSAIHGITNLVKSSKLVGTAWQKQKSPRRALRRSKRERSRVRTMQIKNDLETAPVFFDAHTMQLKKYVEMLCNFEEVDLSTTP